MRGEYPMKTLRYTAVLLTLAALFGLFTLPVFSAASGYDSGSQHLGISGYTVVQMARVGAADFDYTVKARATNNGGDVDDVNAVLVGMQPGVTAIDATVSFGNIPAGTTVESTDTFTVRVNRTAAFDESKLVFEFTVAERVTATFNTNGGSDVSPVEIQQGGTLSAPTAPTRSGYIFEGWYSDAGLTNKVAFPITLTANITLYANWTQEEIEQDVMLQGLVRDVDGNPISNVMVVTGSTSTYSASDGTFSFQRALVVNDRAVIRFEKNGYFPLTRSGVKQDEMFIDAVLYSKGNSDISVQTTFYASEPQILEVQAGMKVELPASSLMRADDGTPYDGVAVVDMFYLDPNNENFANLMPGGDLIAIRSDDSEVMLISWGMVNVNLTDDFGNPLQIKTGQSAEVTFPIPSGMENNPPYQIPLWHFDEDMGIWTETGIATLQGNVYIGEVTHFSWVNLDNYYSDLAVIYGRVVNSDNQPAPFIEVKIGQTATRTYLDGSYKADVPAGTPVVVSVAINGMTVDSESVPGLPGLGVYAVRDLVLPVDAPISSIIYGRVVYDNGQPAPFALVTAGFYDNHSSLSVSIHTDENGYYSMIFPADTPFVVRATMGGSIDSDSVSVPGLPGNTEYAVRDLVLPSTSIIYGRVVYDNDQPAPSVLVIVTDYSGNMLNFTYTDENGYYSRIVPADTPFVVSATIGSTIDSYSAPGLPGFAEYVVRDLVLPFDMATTITILVHVHENGSLTPFAKVTVVYYSYSNNVWTVVAEASGGGYYVIPADTPFVVNAEINGKTDSVSMPGLPPDDAYEDACVVNLFVR